MKELYVFLKDRLVVRKRVLPQKKGVATVCIENGNRKKICGKGEYLGKYRLLSIANSSKHQKEA